MNDPEFKAAIRQFAVAQPTRPTAGELTAVIQPGGPLANAFRQMVRRVAPGKVHEILITRLSERSLADQEQRARAQGQVEVADQALELLAFRKFKREQLRLPEREGLL